MVQNAAPRKLRCLCAFEAARVRVIASKAILEP
jgi:hypothetical protein